LKWTGTQKKWQKVEGGFYYNESKTKGGVVDTSFISRTEFSGGNFLGHHAVSRIEIERKGNRMCFKYVSRLVKIGGLEGSKESDRNHVPMGKRKGGEKRRQ